MRWTCPHCKLTVTTADDQIQTSWSVTRCHGCGGHALLRKSELNLIKIDRAPAGEPVITTSPDSPPPPPPTPIIQPPITLAPELAPPQTKAPSNLISAGIGMTFAAAIFSGIFLCNECISLWQRAHEPAATPAVASQTPPVVSDRLQQSAMAPQREVVRQAREEPSPPEMQHTGLLVHTTADEVKLRSGPGQQFPIVGYADSDEKYVVTDWKDHWYKIVVPEARQSAWVRSDSVELTTR